MFVFPQVANSDGSCCSSAAANDPMVTRSYPVCFFDRRPSDAELRKFRDSAAEFVAPYMPGEQFTLGFTYDTRWMSLEGRQRGHTALKRVWPRIGCVGRYISQGQYVSYQRCVDYLSAFLEQTRYEFMGGQSDGDGISGQLFCDGK